MGTYYIRGFREISKVSEGSLDFEILLLTTTKDHKIESCKPVSVQLGGEAQ